MTSNCPRWRPIIKRIPIQIPCPHTRFTYTSKVELGPCCSIAAGRLRSRLASRHNIIYDPPTRSLVSGANLYYNSDLAVAVAPSSAEDASIRVNPFSLSISSIDVTDSYLVRSMRSSTCLSPRLRHTCQRAAAGWVGAHLVCPGLGKYHQIRVVPLDVLYLDLRVVERDGGLWLLRLALHESLHSQIAVELSSGARLNPADRRITYTQKCGNCGRRAGDGDRCEGASGQG